MPKLMQTLDYLYTRLSSLDSLDSTERLVVLINLAHTSHTIFKKMAHVQAFSVAWYISYVTVLMLLHFPSSKATGFSLKLIPLFSPESLLYPGNLTQFERIHKIFEISKARAHYLASMSKPDAFLNPEDIYLRVHEKNYFYTVDVLFGAPTNQSFCFSTPAATSFGLNALPALCKLL